MNIASFSHVPQRHGTELGEMAGIDIGTPPPVTGPTVGADLPSLVSAGFGLLVWWRQRRKAA
jgi:hypothetical protein